MQQAGRTRLIWWKCPLSVSPTTIVWVPRTSLPRSHVVPAPENVTRGLRDAAQLVRFVGRRCRARMGRGDVGGPAGLAAPIEVSSGSVTLRSLSRADRESWVLSRAANEGRMVPWWTMPADWTENSADDAFFDHWMGWAFAQRRGSGHSLAILTPEGLIGELQLYRGADPRVAEVGVWCRPGRVSTRSLYAAIHLLLDVLTFERGMERIDAPVAVGNSQPLLMLSRAGFEREGTLRRWRPLHGEMVDMVMYGLTLERWSALRAPVPEAVPTARSESAAR